uniref:Uncharacterized protein n=1 Tax=Solanum tuberosum TaxID=4113 RepID=M1DJI2_SOLTU
MWAVVKMAKKHGSSSAVRSNASVERGMRLGIAPVAVKAGSRYSINRASCCAYCCFAS